VRDAFPWFWVSGLGFRVSVFGFRGSGSGFRVSGFEFRVAGFGFRVLAESIFTNISCVIPRDSSSSGTVQGLGFYLFIVYFINIKQPTPCPGQLTPYPANRRPILPTDVLSLPTDALSCQPTPYPCAGKGVPHEKFVKMDSGGTVSWGRASSGIRVCTYRGTSLTRNRPPVETYSRTMPRDPMGVGVYYEHPGGTSPHDDF